MVITFQQIMGCIGYVDMLLIKIKNLVEDAVSNPDPNITSIEKQQAAHDLDKIQILLNTVYQALGRTQPTSIYTLAQLQSMSIT